MKWNIVLPRKKLSCIALFDVKVNSRLNILSILKLILIYYIRNLHHNAKIQPALNIVLLSYREILIVL